MCWVWDARSLQAVGPGSAPSRAPLVPWGGWDRAWLGTGGSSLSSTWAQGRFAARGRGSLLRVVCLRSRLHPRAFADSFQASEHPNTAGGIASSVPAPGGPPVPRGLARGGTSASPAQRPSCQLGMNPRGTDVGNHSAGPRAPDGLELVWSKAVLELELGTGVAVVVARR